MSLHSQILRDRSNEPDRRFSTLLLRSTDPLPGDSAAMTELLRETGLSLDDLYRAESHVLRHVALMAQAQAWRDELPQIEKRLADAQHRAKTALEVDAKTLTHPRHLARQDVATLEMEKMVLAERIRLKMNEARLLRASQPLVFNAWPSES